MESGSDFFQCKIFQRILDPRALLFCAWLRRSRGLGNPGWKVSSHWLSWATIRSVSDRVIHVHARTEQHTIGKRSSGFKGHGSSLFSINDALHGPKSCQDLAIVFPQSFQSLWSWNTYGLRLQSRPQSQFQSRKWQDSMFFVLTKQKADPGEEIEALNDGFGIEVNSLLVKRVTLTLRQYKFFFHRFLAFYNLGFNNHWALLFRSKMAVHIESRFTFM